MERIVNGNGERENGQGRGIERKISEDDDRKDGEREKIVNTKLKKMLG